MRNQVEAGEVFASPLRLRLASMSMVAEGGRVKPMYDRDIHHRQSIRLDEFDYRSVGYYFVTICAFQRECLFGEVAGGGIQLSDLGIPVERCWRAIPSHFLHVQLDEFVIMPNHLHAILYLAESVESVGPFVGAKQNLPASPGFTVPGFANVKKHKEKGEAGESFASPLHLTLPQPLTPNGTTSGSLGAVIQNFKSVSTRSINKLRENRGQIWQRNYYEHVIRDEDDLVKIRQYIVENPLKWDLDEDNLANGK